MAFDDDFDHYVADSVVRLSCSGSDYAIYAHRIGI